MNKIKEQRCLRTYWFSAEDLAIHLKLNGAIVNVIQNPSSGIIEFFVWDETNPLAEAQSNPSVQKTLHNSCIILDHYEKKE